MSEEFQLSYSQVSWVSAIYLLIYAIGSAVYGKLADLFKLKNLITFGLVFFCIGSLIGLASQAYWMVLLGRVLQACGAAVIPAISMIVPVRYFPAERRGWALGITASGLAIGSVISPVTSAMLVSLVHWRWLFCLPMFLVLTLPLYRKYLGDERGNGGKLDWIGGGLLAVTVASLLLAVTFADWLPAVISTGVYSKVVDQGTAFRLNPFYTLSDSYVYSNIYFVLAFTVLGVWIMYHAKFRNKMQLRGEILEKKT